MSTSVIIERPRVQIAVQSGGLVPLNEDLALEAGMSLSALRAVTTNGSGQAVYADTDTLANAMVVGITQNAAAALDTVTLRTFGILEDSGWTWTKGTVYLGTNGTLTQSAPSGGAVVVPIGRALTATKLFIDIDTTIQTV